MALDPSVILAAKSAPPDYGALMAQFAGTANSLAENRLFQNANTEFQAKLASGRATQGAIDPSGRFDPMAANRLISADPDAAFAAPEAVAANQTQTSAQYANSDAAMKLIQQEQELLRNSAAKLSATPPGQLTRERVLGELGNLTPLIQQLPAPLQPGAIAQLKSVADGVPDTDEGIRQWLRGAMVQGQPSGEQTESVFGKAVPVDQGPQVQVENINPQTNSVTPMGAPIAKAVPPQLVTTGPTVAPVKGDLATGGINTGPGAVRLGLSPEVASTPTPTFQGGQPGTKPRAELQPGSGFNPTGAKLGQAEAASVTGQQSAQQGVALQHRADQVPQTKALLGNLEGELSKVKTGPGADWINFGKAFANRNNPFGFNVFDPTQIASQEEFNKQAIQLAQSQFQALGGTGTDAKLGSALHTSPNSALSSMGNEGIIALLKGNEDAIASKNRAWQKWLKAGNGSETYGDFSTQFNSVYDPRVFQFQYMPKAEQQKALSGMSGAERQQFERDQSAAKKFGWIK